MGGRDNTLGARGLQNLPRVVIEQVLRLAGGVLLVLLVACPPHREACGPLFSGSCPPRTTPSP